MNRATSLYLDALRILAAFGVFLGHADLGWFSARPNLFPNLGHECVVVFFFLSGYVIADATLGRSQDLRYYVATRLSRLYSVVAPALLLTAGLQVIGTYLNPTFYVTFERGHGVLRWLLSGLFLQETWFLSGSPPSNGPMWSLGYEFWYYVLFACWVFARNPRQRLAAVALAAAVAGPKLFLLLPLWLLGVACWTMRKKWAMPPAAARIGWLVTGAAVALVAIRTSAAEQADVASPPWFYSAHFARDWLLGIAIFAHVFCFERAFTTSHLGTTAEGAIRRVAGMTFSLYAYHYPLLVFFAATVRYDKSNLVQLIAVLVAVFIVVLGIHRVTEAQRQPLRRWLTMVLEKVAPSPSVSMEAAS